MSESAISSSPAVPCLPSRRSKSLVRARVRVRVRVRVRGRVGVRVRVRVRVRGRVRVRVRVRRDDDQLHRARRVAELLQW